MGLSRWIGGAAALVLLPLAGRGLAQDAAGWTKLLEGSKKTLTEAIEAARPLCGEGTPFHAELEADEGKIVFSIDIAQGTKTCNAVINATDGTLVEKEIEEEDHSAAVAGAKMSLVDAIKAAISQAKGSAVEAKLSARTGKPQIAIKVVSGDKLTIVVFDAVTGLRVEGENPGSAAQESGFTDSFVVGADEWASRGSNPWFSLDPGTVLVLEGKDEGKDVVLTITVLDETKKVDGVETRIVEEREAAGGEVVEISRNYFAISKRTNCVYYFGEDVDMYEGGKVKSHGGSWHSGENGAKFGLMMAGTPLLGARYYQEVAPGVAMDRAEIVSLDETVETPAGKHTSCLRVQETTPIEQGSKEYKSYARGIGLVRDGHLRLTKKISPK